MVALPVSVKGQMSKNDVWLSQLFFLSGPFFQGCIFSGKMVEDAELGYWLSAGLL